MGSKPVPWAVVLAAGEGTRLRALTTDEAGRSTPKQFCTLGGAPSLLRLALRRAAGISVRSRIVTIVAASHERWWRDELVAWPQRNVIAQPLNRGTAIGLLLPVLSIVDRDPDARIVVLPSDHFVADEAALARALAAAMEEIERRPERLVLLGIVPDEPDSGFGWIVPEAHAPGIRAVQRFVEKPPPAMAAELLERGGVWNSFILAASGTTLLELFERRLPGTVTTLWETLGRGPGALSEAYLGLASADFSRDVLEGREERLSVLPVSDCGWSDLGTPERVARCLARLDRRRPPRARKGPATGRRIDLARALVQPTSSV